MSTKKHPLSFLTALEVAKFRINPQHHIPEEHHYNLLMLNGTRKSDLKNYINYRHSIGSDTIVEAIIDSENKSKHLLDSKFFVKYLTHSYSYCKEIQGAIVKSRGVFWMLEKDFVINKEIMDDFIVHASPEQLDKLIPFVGLLFNSEQMVLESCNLRLIGEYVTKHNVSLNNQTIITKYADESLMKTFITHQKSLSDEVIKLIIKFKAIEIVSLLASKIVLTDEQCALLIKRQNWDLLKKQLKIRDETFSSDNIALLTKIADDELFKQFALNGWKTSSDSLTYPQCFFERLFEPKNREVLKDFVDDCCLPCEYEIRLLQSNEEEIIQNYSAGTTFDNETAIFILKNGNNTLVKKVLEDGIGIGYYAESWLFKSGLDEYIKVYLKGHFLCCFSEAVLLRYASDEIVNSYLSEIREVSYLVFKAILERGNVDFIKKVLEIHPYFNLKEKYMMLFLELAPVDVIIQHFDNYYNKEEGLIDLPEDWNASSIVFNRGDISLQKFFVERFQLWTEDMVDFIKLGDREVVFNYIKNNELEDSDTLEALLLRQDVEIISFYLDKYEILDYTLEEIILTYFDEEIVRKLQNKAGFGDYGVKEMLDI